MVGADLQADLPKAQGQLVVPVSGVDRGDSEAHAVLVQWLPVSEQPLAPFAIAAREEEHHVAVRVFHHLGESLLGVPAVLVVAGPVRADPLGLVDEDDDRSPGSCGRSAESGQHGSQVLRLLLLGRKCLIDRVSHLGRVSKIVGTFEAEQLGELRGDTRTRCGIAETVFDLLAIRIDTDAGCAGLLGESQRELL